MFKRTLSFRKFLMSLLGLVLFVPGALAQGHQEEHDRGNAGIMVKGSGAYARSSGHRHYYHNGNWNRNGWYGFGVPAPVLSDGVFVSSLPPDSTAVVVAGNPYFYGNGMYFRQIASGGFAVVTL